MNPLTLTLFCAAAIPAIAAAQIVPVVEGPWIPIAGNPDLGEFTRKKQQPVDFGVWQAADGTWQLWSCIRGTGCGGTGRLFHRWEGRRLTEPNWKPMGIAMQADPELGETPGGLQAPHVIRHGGKFHMFYGDWENICHAVSTDGKRFERVVQPSGKTGMFCEAPGANTRDVMLLKVGDLWHAYYTAFPNRQGTISARTTRDFTDWSESIAVAMGGIGGTGHTDLECPHVVARHGKYYLFHTQTYHGNPLSSVYVSEDPLMFGINQDRRYLATRLPIAAPEIVEHEGQDYVFALNPALDGIRLAKLGWQAPAEVGEPVFAFDDAGHRRQWKLESGSFADRFTTSTRTRFDPPQQHFIGTAERGDGRMADEQTGVLRSPVFEIDDSRYFAFVSGGADRDRLYVAIVDAKSGDEIVRITSPAQGNVFSPQLVDVSHAVGRRAYVRVVDESRDSWGHVNFGGLFRARR